MTGSSRGWSRTQGFGNGWRTSLELANKRFDPHSPLYFSGDIGFIDTDGYLHVTGRKKIMIKSGGISIFPEEIEEILLRHPKVSEAAVVGFKSDVWGEG